MADDRDKDYNQICTIFNYHPHPQYGQWPLDGDDGPYPCRLSNWPIEDLVSYVGGEYAASYYTKESN
nr:hypothetical protein GCM10025732_47840 [Glycomyces mayteni]